MYDYLYKHLNIMIIKFLDDDLSGIHQIAKCTAPPSSTLQTEEAPLFLTETGK